MKKFLIIGSANAITYKEVFPLIKNNQMWLGTSKRGMYFVNDGKTVYINSVWFTNLDNKNRHQPIALYKHYNPEEYPLYDNYNAIEVSRTKDIPMDYDGVMGVPITFMDRYCPQQFEIVGATYLYDKNSVRTKVYSSEECRNAYFKLFGKEGMYPLNSGPVIIMEGVLKATYKRILIKRKK